MRSVFAYSGNMADAVNGARALQDVGVLDAFVTTIAWQPNGRAAQLICRLPEIISSAVLRQLERRTVDGIDPDLVHGCPWNEIIRTLASRAGRPIAADRAWDRMSHQFDALVSKRFVPRTEAVHAYEYTALRTFENAKKLGVARVLHLPSLDSRAFEEIQAREKQRWPELCSPHDEYFGMKFEERYERRKQEIALADVIITNSSLTASSHVAAGAASEKVVVVPLAAPPTISDIVNRPVCEPLQVLWAGSFSLGKGAHYALEAWKMLNAGAHARLDVYGTVSVPERVLFGADQTVRFHGPVPQSELFKAYVNADVLLFPTLSDGFGLVVAEAMAHGVPVIVTDQAGAADLVTHENGFIVRAGNPKTLSDALRWCLDNRLRLADMRHHALATARSRQWSDYRRELILALDGGMRRAGYAPAYGINAKPERQLTPLLHQTDASE